MIHTDLETYIASYGDHGKLHRLQFIAHRGSPRIKSEALHHLLTVAKRLDNVKMYQEAHSALKGLLDENVDPMLGSLPHMETDWVNATTRNNAQQQQVFEQDLHQAKVTQIKDSIRLALMASATFYFRRGNYEEALKHYSKSREYTVEAPNVLEMCFASIETVVMLSRYTDIISYAAKAQHTPYKTPKDNARVTAAHGLYYLKLRKYKDAAESFLGLKPNELGESFKNVLTVQDVALYGSLCALASYTRTELNEKIGEKSVFRETLDFVPIIRDLTLDFCQCHYKRCLEALYKIKPSADLDVYLSAHWTELIRNIRDKAIVQYFSPFLSVSLANLAAELNTDVEGIETEAANLIAEKKISAKIDSHKKVLLQRDTDLRRSTYKDAMRLGQEFFESTQQLLLRMNLVKYDMAVKPSRK
ncbi:unnamed protein product [Vitrella brassicaformis CCMP3155]|uniref:PCI domain-containing protein n=1 Tax=Vitrella brassicaformis (strain CCMP3155) TaxID=1169540 RepID=A0A0G4GJM3_VITBC|nr:unnamed protein product [Vitrella brassicaformis CCMP3155]|mmetsp:Transcript_24566/g.60719  ORF Transcript_24566/g.60719 Transcript_24566/m.60719 type:complete len:417 (-) Transcript_24566:384-1634(-)|eukprot:CEM30080.1 unnamed protein product [Vitrella brassicaformis CCMP3155]